MNEIIEAHPRRTISISKRLVLIIVLVIVLIASFFGGMHYEKNHLSKVVTTSQSLTGTPNGLGGTGSTNGFGGGGGSSGGFRREGAVGSVTAISGSSITISNLRTSSAETFTISASTTFMSSGSTAMASDIAVGDIVLVRTASQGSTLATSISIIPSSGGGGFGGPMQGATNQ